jgi:putative ABC transport system substrate-binding protein
MNRRRLLGWLAGIAVAGPWLARAQQAGAPARIGYLSAGPRDGDAGSAFFGELSRLGHVEGRNLTVLFDEYGEKPDRLPALVTKLVRAPVDVIVAEGSEAPLRAAHAATERIPIVMIAINYDPIERGYAKSLAHPGGNVTGVFFRSLELVAKQVELLKAMVPEATRLTVLWGAETEDEFGVAESSAKALGLTMRSFKLDAPPYDFDAVFRGVAEDAPQIVLVLATPAFSRHHARVAAAALHYRLPAMFRFRDYVEFGGLMSYGVNSLAMRRLAAAYVAKILGGARPADLPVQRADKFELVINMKTATALGLTVPQSLFARADEVIE